MDRNDKRNNAQKPLKPYQLKSFFDLEMIKYEMEAKGMIKGFPDILEKEESLESLVQQIEEEPRLPTRVV